MRREPISSAWAQLAYSSISSRYLVSDRSSEVFPSYCSPGDIFVAFATCELTNCAGVPHFIGVLNSHTYYLQVHIKYILSTLRHFGCSMVSQADIVLPSKSLPPGKDGTWNMRSVLLGSIQCCRSIKKKYLKQKLTNFFCNGPGRKYQMLCRSWGPCCFQLCESSHRQYINNEYVCAEIKVFLQKQTVGWI